MSLSQFVGGGLIATLALTIYSVFVEPDYEGGVTSLVGAMYWVFGIWAAIILLKKK